MQSDLNVYLDLKVKAQSDKETLFKILLRYNKVANEIALCVEKTPEDENIMKHAPSTTSSNLSRKEIFGAAYAQPRMCQLFVCGKLRKTFRCLHSLI